MTVSDEIAERNVREIVSIFSAVGEEESRAMLRQAAGTDALLPQVPATQKAWKERGKAWNEIADSFSDLVAEDSMVISRRGIDEEVIGELDTTGGGGADADEADTGFEVPTVKSKDVGSSSTTTATKETMPKKQEYSSENVPALTEKFTLDDIANLLQSELVLHDCSPKAGLWFYFVAKLATTEKASDGSGLKRRARCYFGAKNLERVGGWYLEHFRRSRGPAVIVDDTASSAAESSSSDEPEKVKDDPQLSGPEEYLIHTAKETGLSYEVLQMTQQRRWMENGTIPRSDDEEREREASKPVDELISNIVSGQFQKVLEGKEKSHAAKAMKKERDEAIKAGNMEKPPRNAQKPHKERRENRYKTQVSVSDSSAHSITDLERKFDGLSSRVSALEMRVTGVEVRMTSVENKLDTVIGLLHHLVGDDHAEGLTRPQPTQKQSSKSGSASSSSQMQDFTVPPIRNTPLAKSAPRSKSKNTVPAKPTPSEPSDTDVPTPRVKKVTPSAKASSSNVQKASVQQPAPKQETKRSGPPGGYTKAIAAVTSQNVNYVFAHFKYPDVVVTADKFVYPHLSNPDIITEARVRSAFAKASKRRFAKRSATEQKTFSPHQAYEETLKVLRIVDNVVREECQ